MSWKYCPISIRFINRFDANDIHNVSGIHLEFIDAGIKLFQYNLTVNVFGAKRMQTYEVYVSSKSLISEENEIQWFKGEIDFDLSLMDEEFGDFLDYFKRNGFNFVPSAQLNDSLSFNILNLKVSYKLETVPIEFVDTSEYDEIDVLAYPFNISNPILFSGMKLSGHVNYITKFGYLTDIRYIDNITGGVVNKRNENVSLGLIMTDIKRINGDGDLVFVLKWNWIWSVISRKFPNNRYITSPLVNRLSGGMVSVQKELSTVKMRKTSVLPISISSVYKHTWGSCVMFNSEYIITNYHVISPYLTYPASTARIYITETDFITIGDRNDIITTFKDIDLVFIRLSLQDQFKLLHKAHIVPLSFTTDYQVGDQVRSIGYGLFFNSGHVKPIESNGIIMLKKEAKLQKNDDIDTVALMVTSAPCWNGSSGGGLFKGTEFVGLICSNAQIKAFDVTTNDYRSEKVQDLCFMLPIESILECFRVIRQGKFEVHMKFKNLWNLIDNFSNNYEIDEKNGRNGNGGKNGRNGRNGKNGKNGHKL